MGLGRGQDGEPGAKAGGGGCQLGKAGRAQAWGGQRGQGLGVLGSVPHMLNQPICSWEVQTQTQGKGE